MSSALPGIALWSALTFATFTVARLLHRRWPHRWLTPILTTPLLIGAVVGLAGARFDDYLTDTHWIVLLLGPVTVAFAVPIYEQRELIRRSWRVLLAGMVAGNVTAVVTGWALATSLGLDDQLTRSLLPRSITTPFAMSVSSSIGGVPALTAAFTVATGLLGALLGELLLVRLRLRSELARGALFGVGAHGIGTVSAREVGQTEGAVAGLCMVLTGLMSVLVAPLIALVL